MEPFAPVQPRQQPLFPIPSQLQTVLETRQQQLEQQTVLITEADEASKEQTPLEMQPLGQKRGSKAVVAQVAAPAGRQTQKDGHSC